MLFARTKIKVGNKIDIIIFLFAYPVSEINSIA